MAHRADSLRMMCWYRRWLIFFLLAVVVAVSCSLVYALEGSAEAGSADEVGDPSTVTSDTDTQPESPPIKVKKRETPSGNDDDWGSFYDPNKVFCGKFDCYKILGFDHETWGSNPPTLKDITKSYRALSRKWHPDKNNAKGAREKFVAIAKAYEILTNKDKRAEYDHFRDRPDEYFAKYGSSVLYSYVPKSDAHIIVTFFLIVGNMFTYYAQKNKWQTIANHLVKAAVEDLSPREGGSTESINIRAKAMAILAEKRGEEKGEKQLNGTNTDKKRKGPRMTSREKKEKEWDELRPICTKLVNEIDDFGAGYRKPTYQDFLIVKMIKWPYYLTTSTLWWSKYAVRRLRKLEINDEEREVLTKNAVGEVTWVSVSEEEREKMLTLQLWVTDNLVEWREDQEMKLAGLSATKMKQIKKMRKKIGVESGEDLHMD